MIQKQLKNCKKFSTILFAGQGSQKVGMTKQYQEANEPMYNAMLNDFNKILGIDIKNLMLNGPKEDLNLTYNTQPAIFINQFLGYQNFLQNNGREQVEFVIGNSVGEYTALTVAGILDPLQTVKILKIRGELMQKACEELHEVKEQCGMLAVSSENQESTIIKEMQSIQTQYDLKEGKQEIDLALYNSNKQVVFSGHMSILKDFQKSLKEKGISSLFLKVSAAFHSKILTSIKPEFEEELRKLSISVPENQRMKVIRNVDTSVYKYPEEVIQGLLKQLDQPVMFYQSVCKALLDHQQTKFIEIGNTNVLNKFVQQTAEQFCLEDLIELQQSE